MNSLIDHTWCGKRLFLANKKIMILVLTLFDNQIPCFILPRVVSRGWQSSAKSGPLGGLGPVRRPLNLYNVPIIKKLQSSLLGFLPPPKIILKNANHKQI